MSYINDLKLVDWLLEESYLMEATLGEIYDQYYSQIIDRETYDKLAMVDPTAKPDKKGKYLDWLIRKAFKKNPRILEDESKVKEDLSLFDKFGGKLGKQIGQLKDQYDLATTVKEIRDQQDNLKSNKEKKTEIKLKGSDRIFEDDTWLILTPKTKEASCYYGKGTRWCTAADKNNMFDNYNNQGKLYIIINKKDPSEKFQLHFETQSFMDIDDSPVEDIVDVLPKEIIDKLTDIANEYDTHKHYYWLLAKTGRLLQLSTEEIAHYIIEQEYLYGIPFSYDFDMLKDSGEQVKHSNNKRFRFKIGEYDTPSDIWSEFGEYSKDISYEIFDDPSNWNWIEADIEDVIREVKDYKHLFPTEDSYNRAIETLRDEDEEIEDSYDIITTLISAYRDSRVFGTELEAMSDFYNKIRTQNEYGLRFVLPTDSDNDKYELWLTVDSSNITDAFDEDFYDVKNIFTFGFDVENDWYGFDNENFKSELKRAFKL